MMYCLCVTHNGTFTTIDFHGPLKSIWQLVSQRRQHPLLGWPHSQCSHHNKHVHAYKICILDIRQHCIQKATAQTHKGNDNMITTLCYKSAITLYNCYHVCSYEMLFSDFAPVACFCTSYLFIPPPRRKFEHNYEIYRENAEVLGERFADFII